MSVLIRSLSRSLHTSPACRASKLSPAELTKILQNRITNFTEQQEVEEVGRVLSVSDGIARIYGLKKVKAGEMVVGTGEITTHVLGTSYKAGQVAVGAVDVIPNIGGCPFHGGYAVLTYIEVPFNMLGRPLQGADLE